MRPEVVAFLRCPVCGQQLWIEAGPRGPLRCTNRHSFDQSRQGYAQLTAGPLTHTGDSASMIEARESFLNAGHYAPVTDALRDAAKTAWPGGLVFDLGAGPGRYLASVLNVLSGAYGLAADASKAAARAAAKAHPRADAIVCDAWQPLPLADNSVGVALNVFAPRPGGEFARVLRDDGVLLVVTPTAAHLQELIGPLGLLSVDPAKPERISEALSEAFRLDHAIDIEALMTLGSEDVASLVGMGPSARHVDPGALAQRVARLPSPTPVTLSVTVASYRPR